MEMGLAVEHTRNVDQFPMFKKNGFSTAMQTFNPRVVEGLSMVHQVCNSMLQIQSRPSAEDDGDSAGSILGKGYQLEGITSHVKGPRFFPILYI